MLTKLDNVRKLIGNTPLFQIEKNDINLFVKMEMLNFTGSIKIRPAYHILYNAIHDGYIDENTKVIESTSGNFGVALANLCKFLGIRFIPVIDPNINTFYEKQLNITAHKVIKVSKRDETGGYLKTRLERVKQLLKETENIFWTNQYANKDNYHAHYRTLGREIIKDFESLDYAFIGVSSCGTITGLSQKLKENFPNIKIIAVDSEGSVIFGEQPKKRYISGIGSSIVPSIINKAQIDEIVMVPEIKAISGCHSLLSTHGIFAGGSSGAVYYAIKQYFKNKKLESPPNVLSIFVDSGSAYMDTVFNQSWVDEIWGQELI